MENSLVEKLLKDIAEFRETLSDKTLKQLNLKLLDRAIIRLGSFSPDCEECHRQLEDLNDHIEKLKNLQGQFEKHDIKEHKAKQSQIISHLQKEHKLVTEGQYAGTYMAVGLSMGVPFGLLLFDNVGLGIPIGLSIGLAIGSSKDAEAKKKGLTI